MPEISRKDYEFLQSKLFLKKTYGPLEIYKAHDHAFRGDYDPRYGKYRTVIISGRQIVALGFEKFHNVYKSNLDESKIYNFEWKHDGSMLIVFWFEGELIIATKGVIGGANTATGNGKTFKQMFEETIKALDMKFEDDGNMYIFELITKDNKIVVDYDKPKMVLIGARNSNMEEIDPDPIAKKYDWERPVTFRMTLQDAQKMADDEPGNVLEGFILRDERRWKVKNKNWIEMSNVKNNQKDTNILDDLLESILEGNISDIKDGYTRAHYNCLLEKINSMKESFSKISNLNIGKERGLKLKEITDANFKDFGGAVICRTFLDWINYKHNKSNLYKSLEL